MTTKTDRSFFLDPNAEDFSFHKMDLDRVRRDAGRMQAEMVSRHVGLLGSALWRATKWTGRTLASAYTMLMGAVAAQHAFEALNRLSDADLERIGLTREEIPHRVAAILDTAYGEAGSSTSDLYAVEGGRKAETRKPRTEVPHRRAA